MTRQSFKTPGLAALCILLVALAPACGNRELISTQRSEETTAARAEETTGIEIASDPELVTASNRYRDYVVEQIDELSTNTEAFTRAVEDGDVERAKELYPAARVPWERIEPIAASLGDYDPAIDAREGDVPADEWTGFHPIEKALWVDNTTEGQEQNARKLREDVDALKDEVETLEVTPVNLVTGSVDLLNEVSAGKITGEEERYSHVDLYDFQANLEGSEKAFELLTPSLEERDPELVQEVRSRFDDIYAELDKYRDGEGWVSYEEVDEAERRVLSQKLDALAEPLSQVGSVLSEK